MHLYNTPVPKTFTCQPTWNMFYLFTLYAYNGNKMILQAPTQRCRSVSRGPTTSFCSQSKHKQGARLTCSRDTRRVCSMFKVSVQAESPLLQYANMVHLFTGKKTAKYQILWHKVFIIKPLHHTFGKVWETRWNMKGKKE